MENTINSETKVRTFYSAEERFLSITAIVLGFIYFRFVSNNGYTTIPLMFYIVVNVILLLYLHRNYIRPDKKQWAMYGVIQLFSFIPLLGRGEFVCFLSVVFTFVMTLYWVYSISEDVSMFDASFVSKCFQAVFKVPFNSIGKCLGAVGSTVIPRKNNKTLLYVIIGFATALPFTFVVAGLLSSADDNFQRLFDKGFTDLFGNFLGDFIVPAGLGILFASFVFGAAYSAVHKRGIVSDTNFSGANIAPSAVLYSAVAPVWFLYIAFFIVQLPYFISAFSGVLPDNYSYSDYARKGFFELLAVAIINLGIIMLIHLFAKRCDGKKPFSVKFITITTSAMTLLLIATAVSKMLLYISQYGLTRLRVYTMWFMILLAAFFAILILWECVKINLSKWLFASFTVLFAVLCFGNADGLIVNYNVQMYLSGSADNIDTNMIKYELEPSSAKYLIPAADSNPEIRRCLEYIMEDYNINPVSFATFTFEDYTAITEINDYLLTQ